MEKVRQRVSGTTLCPTPYPSHRNESGLVGTKTHSYIGVMYETNEHTISYLFS